MQFILKENDNSYRILFGPEIGYVNRISSYEINGSECNGNGCANFNFSNHFIQLILNGRAELKNSFYFGGGPYLSLLLKSKWEESSYSSNADGEIEDEYLNKIDFGISLEMGVILFKKIEVGVRTDIGFVNIIHTPVEKIKTKSIFFTFGTKYN